MATDFYSELDLAFHWMKIRSEMERLKLYSEFAAFYNNDYENIQKILYDETLNNPYSAETLKTLKFSHVNMIDKTISRLTSGIYTIQPKREYDDAEKIDDVSANDNLENFLAEIKYNQKIKDGFKKAVYYNVVLLHPVYDAELKKIRIDVITPDNFTVKTKKDFYQIEEVALKRADQNGEIYYSIWNSGEHYIRYSGTEIKISPDGNESGVNPFSPVLPFTILRIKDGNDFYGEPNWNLYLNQKDVDKLNTDLVRSQIQMVNNIWFGVNTDLPSNTSFTAGQLIQVKQPIDGLQVSLDSISANVDYDQARENIDWKIKTVQNSEGLSSSSTDTKVSQLSGVAKNIDELELYEKREEYKEILFNAEQDLIGKCIMVNNKYFTNSTLPEVKVNIYFSEDKESESIDDKIKRRKMETDIGYKSPVDYTMEDLEVSEKEAIQILTDAKAENEQFTTVAQDNAAELMKQKNNVTANN